MSKLEKLLEKMKRSAVIEEYYSKSKKGKTRGKEPIEDYYAKENDHD